MSEGTTERKPVKCVVWDLDHTLWRGILLEDEEVTLRPGLREIVQALDARGVLQSLASKNEHAVAMAKLEELGLAEYFLYPQIHWGPKSGSIKAIAAALNLGVDAFAFVDDQPFERDEVRFALPEVLCIDAADADQILSMPAMQQRFITEDSRRRREMYLSDIERKRAEEAHAGAPAAFLASLGMRFTISTARESDLQRAEELTLRTNQLNTTGRPYTYDQLNAFRTSPRHLLLIAGLDDKYGTYGKIGLMLVEHGAEVWTIKLFLMSCRVMSRGVGAVFCNHVRRLARAGGVRLRADFVQTDRNRAMMVTYRFLGFREVEKDGALSILEDSGAEIAPPPDHLTVIIETPG